MVFYMVIITANALLLSLRTVVDCQSGNSCEPGYICKKLNECPKALENLKENITPTICGFHLSTPIVCCNSDDSASTNATTSTTTTTTSTTTQSSVVQNGGPPVWTWKPKPNVNPQQRVLEKCKEYKRRQYIEKVIPSQLPGQRDMIYRLPNCHQATTLITGGVDAVPKEFPHMALIGFGDTLSDVKWSCGGSLISERFVLTAAHCSEPSIGLARWVRLGDLDYSVTTDDADPMDYRIVERILHPNYSPSSSYNDIALFKLDRNVTFNAYRRPICLNTERNTKLDHVVATGWGTLGTGWDVSPHLQKVKLPLVSHRQCQLIFPPDSVRYDRGIDDNSMICAGEKKGGKDTCQGDSGGPLGSQIVGEPCMYLQIGITSFGRECGTPNSAAVYTRVSHFIPWIQRIVWP